MITTTASQYRLGDDLDSTDPVQVPTGDGAEPRVVTAEYSPTRCVVRSSEDRREPGRGTGMAAPLAPCDGADSDCAGEHRWLAREIHDWVGNGASLALRHLDLFEIYRDRCNPAADRQVADARRAIEELLQSTRWLVSGLRERFRVSSLDSALQDFLSGANPAGVRTTVTVRGAERLLPPSYRDELFVVVREALRNAFAHARATQVDVTIDISVEEVRAVVQDDGAGFDVRAASATGSSGLASMRERLELIGGRLAIVSRPSSGTRVELMTTLPGGSERDGH